MMMFKFRIFSICVILINFFVLVVSKDWSYFVFAQQWPPAACLNVPHGKCLISKVVTDWSIHGLWPTSHKGYPSFCNTSWPFKPQALKPILLQLEAKWPNIFADSSETSFWKHEWLKHGTCAASLPSFNSELKYFKRSLQLHDQLNIREYLQKAGLTPSQDTPILLKYVENAINMHVNVTTKLFCQNHKNYTKPILTSMYICMDKQLNLIGCDEIKEPTCSSTYVYYLPFPDRKIEVERSVFLV